MPVDPFGVVEIVGMRRALGRFAQATPALRRAQRAQVRLAGQRLLEATRAEAPVSPERPDRPAGVQHIRDQINMRVRSSGADDLMIEIYVPVAQQRKLMWITQGTSEHGITPRVQQRLRFWWPNGPRGARMYSFSKVSHPGAKPNDFVRRVFDREAATTIAELRKIANQVLIGVTATGE